MKNGDLMKSVKEVVPVILLLLLSILIIWSYINPFDIKVWYVEISSVLIVTLALVLTYRFFKFSNTAYFIVFLWLVLHTVGAHYSFERVPFDFFTSLFGFTRNNFDRFAHFIIGINAFGVAEFLFRTRRVNSVKVAAFFGVIFIMALANAWELIEWIYAEIDGGEVGVAFLGSQGDIWDAQKDMLADTLGAILGAFIFLYCNRSK